MNFDERFSEFQQLIEKRLSEYVKVEQPKELYEPYAYIMAAGGKRIRPALTITACGAVGGDPMQALDNGLAIEIMHNFTLVHDDIMDKSPIRRGRPTVHVKWNDSIAILAGDMMIGQAYELLSIGNGAINQAEIFKQFNTGLIEVCEGQVWDMEFESRNDVSMDEYLLMIEKKTSRLLETCAVSGGYTGGATPEMIAALRSYSINMGLAFQIQDDMLDLTADQVKFGKKVGQDIIEGKKTYLVLKARELAVEASDIELIDKYMNSKGLEDTYVEKFREMFTRLGVLEISQATVDSYFQKAKDELVHLPKNEYTAMLDWFIDKLNKRVF